MQLKKEQLQRQQMIMTVLGYYRHRCDGIWGPEAIAAKRRWESEKPFIPALPTNGLPFGDRDTYPAGVTYDRASRMLKHALLTQEKIDEYLASAVKKTVETSVEPTPVVEEVSVVEEAVETQEETQVQENTVQQQNFQHKKFKQR